MNLDIPLKVCFFKKAGDSLIKEITLTKELDSSFMSLLDIDGKTTFSTTPPEIAQLKACIDDTLSDKKLCNYM